MYLFYLQDPSTEISVDPPALPKGTYDLSALGPEAFPDGVSCQAHVHDIKLLETVTHTIKEIQKDFSFCNIEFQSQKKIL